jgi:glycosyltransferase involved in cell wall biosynthesis
MLSVVINAKNEQEMIKTCLESVKFADEMVVVLNDSTDNTEEIARKYTDRIFKISGQDFAKVKNLGLEKTSGDWVLFVDADERVLEDLKREIKDIIQSSEKSAYAISRKNIIFGKGVNYGPYKHDWVIRLVRKEKAKGWVGKVHEHLEFSGDLGYTKNSFLHLTHRDLDHFVLKALEWSYIDAQLKIDANHAKMDKKRFIKLIFTELNNQLIKRKGGFGGTVGTIDAILQAFSTFMSYVRLWQMQQPTPLPEKYLEIDKKLIETNFKY